MESTHGRGKKYYVAKPTLLGISQDVSDKYKERMWTEDTFVIGKGKRDDTMDFLDQIHLLDFRLIQKVHLAFTNRDHYDRKYFLRVFSTPAPGDPDRDDYIRWANKSLRDIWWDKFYAIEDLRLEELTLDFTECYGFDGRWLGLELVEELNYLGEGIPADLRILAPDQEKRKDLMAVFVANNT
ncbi:MAG: hypothetical protein Q9201_003017 [Fulgogasparrea decipioides]